MRKLLVILLLAIITAKIAGVLARGPVPIERDALGYWQLSALVMNGDLLMLGEPIAYRTPVYPWFLAIIRSASGPAALTVVAITQGILCLMSVWIAGLIAARTTKIPNALPWTLGVSLPALSAYTYCAAVLSESLFLFLFMLNLLAVVSYAEHGTRGRAAWAGVTFALALLTRPVVLLLWVPHLLLLLYVHFRKRSEVNPHSGQRVKLFHRTGHLLVAVLAIGILITPWLMRNHYLFGRPQLTEFIGRNAWVVTFQDGSGTGLDFPDSESSRELQRRLATVGFAGDQRRTWEVSEALIFSGLDDAQADRLMAQVAWDAIEPNQEAFNEKAFRRIVNFWRCAATDLPLQGPATAGFYGQQMWGWELPPLDMALDYRWSKVVVLNTVLAAASGLALLVLLVNYDSRPYAIWIALIFAYFCVVTGILEIENYRYRIVLEPLIAAVIGSAIAVLLERRQRKAARVTT